MKKLKIYVYAICKNESKFIERWIDSMKEADGIYVLDTGSTDESVCLLQQHGAHVIQKEINPWRFDVARNESLKMVPEDADICVCTDIDEVFSKGWRKTLEQLWIKKQPNRMKYLYHWSFDEFGRPATTFYIDKIHQRWGYSWKHPVHEVLVWEGNSSEQIYETAEFNLDHHPDNEKSRGSYLPLLEMSVFEDPEDDRNMHYLGREYMFHQEWEKAIATLHRHLRLKSATWKDERAASMRFMARSYQALGYFEEASFWFQQAILEAPYLREGYVELGFFEYENQHYQNSYDSLKKALCIKEKSNSYINENFAWNEQFYDMLSLAAYQLGFLEEAYLYSKKAFDMNPLDKRLRDNYELLKSMME